MTHITNLTRMPLGRGARQAAGRRNDLMAQEESSRKETEAYFSAYVRGREGRGRSSGMAGAGVQVVRRGGS